MGPSFHRHCFRLRCNRYSRIPRAALGRRSIAPEQESGTHGWQTSSGSPPKQCNCGAIPTGLSYSRAGNKCFCGNRLRNWGSAGKLSYRPEKVPVRAGQQIVSIGTAARFQGVLLTTLAHSTAVRVVSPRASVRIVALDAEKSIEGVTHEFVQTFYCDCAELSAGGSARDAATPDGQSAGGPDQCPDPCGHAEFATREGERGFEL